MRSLCRSGSIRNGIIMWIRKYTQWDHYVDQEVYTMGSLCRSGSIHNQGVCQIFFPNFLAVFQGFLVNFLPVLKNFIRSLLTDSETLERI